MGDIDIFCAIFNHILWFWVNIARKTVSPQIIHPLLANLAYFLAKELSTQLSFFKFYGPIAR